MATPTVFVSSTFYDLRHMRESVRRFIDQMGYTPVLSEEGTVFYDPETTAAAACLKEVSNADMLVLIIGGRYGSKMESGKSVTNSEYQQARRAKIPVFAMVESGTYNDYRVFKLNSDNRDALNNITFPSADNLEIFDFIGDVETQAENNALVPFSTVGDVEEYLRAQWAGMLHNYLHTSNQEARVTDTLDALTQINRRVEQIAKQILETVGGTTDKAYLQILKLPEYKAAVEMAEYFRVELTPVDVLANHSYQDWLASRSITMNIQEQETLDLSALSVEDPKMSELNAQDRSATVKFGGESKLVYFTNHGTFATVNQIAYDQDEQIFQNALRALDSMLAAANVSRTALLDYARSVEV